MLDKYIRPFPKIIRIEPAGSCNLSCSHCPTGTIKMQRGIMPSETFAILIEGIKRNLDSVKVVVLYHGGEPLLNKSFARMVREIKDLGVPFVKSVSNGMLMTESVINDIIDSNLDAIEFSLDGDTPETNDLVRRNSNYTKVVENVKALVNSKTQKNLDKPQVFISNTQFLSPEFSSDSKRLDDKVPETPTYLLEEFSGEYADKVKFKCTWAMRWPDVEIDQEIYGLYYDTNDLETKSYCDHTEQTMTVRWNGDVVACCYDLTSQEVLGNVKQDSLENIWNNDKYLYLRRSIDQKMFVKLCDNCNVVKPKVYLTLKKPLT